jgi:cell division septum initiation protein DivIVA
MTFSDDVPTAGEASGRFPAVGHVRPVTGEQRAVTGEHRVRDPHQHPEAERLLRRVVDLVSSARPMPLSASVMINKDEVLELLEEAVERLPEELRAARWLLKEREDFLARVHREGDEILDAARAKAERMVQRTEVVKAAEGRARKIQDVAEANARRLRHECEDFCDQKLASFEIVLERTMKMVAAGREKLAGPPLVPEPPPAEIHNELDEGNAFFDQDQP